MSLSLIGEIYKIPFYLIRKVNGVLYGSLIIGCFLFGFVFVFESLLSVILHVVNRIKLKVIKEKKNKMKVIK